MKIGIVSINVGGPATAEKMIETAQHAEAAGIESVWTFEHVIVPTAYESKYPYDRSGKMPIPPQAWFLDPLISLAHVAAATARAHPWFSRRVVDGSDGMDATRRDLGLQVHDLPATSPHLAPHLASPRTSPCTSPRASPRLT